MSVTVLSAPGAGHAAIGAVADPASGGVTPQATGGAHADDHPAPPPRNVAPPRSGTRSARGRPLLTLFEVSPARFFIYGRSARVRFRVEGRARSVRVRLDVLLPGRREPLAAIDLGDRATGTVHTVRLNGRERGVLPQGALQVRLRAHDRRGRPLRRSARTASVRPLEFYWHRFPLRGAFDWGGEGARFGADRPGHSHQGQDLIAAEGTPVVAPRGGLIKTVGFQAAGAGHYVVLDGAGEDRDYAFMHLVDGSIAVREGQGVHTGQLLGHVGSTGASSGPHLHFEVWEGGGWYAGGHPVDPLPYLRRWASWSG